MVRLFVLALLALAAISAGNRKQKVPKPPELEVRELTAKRTTEKTVEIDGTVRNCSEKTLHKVILHFKILDPDEKVLTTQSGPVEGDTLEAGDESEFHWKMRDHARGISVLVEASSNGVEMDVAKAGPYTID